MKLQQLLVSAGYSLAADLPDVRITGISTDSKRVLPGHLFIAVPGLCHNGYDFLAEARDRGAVCAVAERESPLLPTVVLPDVRAAVARLYDAFCGHPATKMRLIGVTGTNGKTSVSTMLFRILCHAGYRAGLIGTVGTFAMGERLSVGEEGLANMTTPDPSELYPLLAEMQVRGVEIVVMEVTSHALYFEKTAPLFFERAVFTNLTPDHLDLHGDMESYYLEKRKLFDRACGAVVSCLSPYGVRLADSLDIPCEMLTPDRLDQVVKKGANGVQFRLLWRGDTYCGVRLPVPGDFSVENGALAALTALSLGITPVDVQEALSGFTGVPGRMERIARNRFDIKIFLDYAHTPDALEKLLLTVRGFRREGERILLLFGCGGDRDRSKRPQMGRIAAGLADYLIVTSDNCRSESPEAIIADILRGVDKEKAHRVIGDRRSAITYAVLEARPGDILLLAGKGHEEYEIRGNRRLSFSERAIVEDALAERARREENAN